jgi:hypothetical protein
VKLTVRIQVVLKLRRRGVVLSPSHMSLYKVKVKVDPNRPRRTHGMSGGIAQLFLNLGTRRG